MGQELLTRLNDGSIDSQMLIGLIDMGIKGLLLMAAAGLAAAAMRKHAAAARHLVWLLALCGLLLLPIVSLLLPKWTLPILPAIEAPVPGPVTTSLSSTPSIQPTTTNAQPSAPDTPTPQNVYTTPAAEPQSMPATPVTAPAARPAPEPVNIPMWLLAIWHTVALISLAPFVAGLIAVLRLRRHADSFADEDIQTLATKLSQSIGLRRPARLLRGAEGTMPMATGFIAPAVFLPADALTWTEEKRRVVLLHELAHVKRGDCLTHAIARVAASLHWFNPLAWLALRQLRIEREHACDDLVLAAGERPSAYAENLLEIARTLRASAVVSAAAITMAQKSQLEGRLLAVLDAARNRGRVTKRLLAACTLGTILVLALISAVEVTRSEADDDIGANPESAASTARPEHPGNDFTAAIFPDARVVIYNGAQGSDSYAQHDFGPHHGKIEKGYPGPIGSLAWTYNGPAEDGWKFSFHRFYTSDFPGRDEATADVVYKGGTLPVMIDEHQWIGIEAGKEIPMLPPETVTLENPMGLPTEPIVQFFAGSRARQERLLREGIKVEFVQRIKNHLDAPDHVEEYLGTLWMLNGNEVVELRDAKGRTARHYQIDGRHVTEGPDFWRGASGNMLLPPNSFDGNGTGRRVGYPINYGIPGSNLALQWKSPPKDDEQRVRESLERGRILPSDMVSSGLANGIPFIAFGIEPVTVAPQTGFAWLGSRDVSASSLFEIGDGLWFPGKVVHAPPPQLGPDGTLSRYHEVLTVVDVILAPEFPEGLFKLPEPDDGDLVYVDYASWNEQWKDNAEVSRNWVLNSVNSEATINWETDMSLEDRGVLEVSEFWRIPGNAEATLDSGKPLPFFDRQADRVVWARYDSNTQRIIRLEETPSSPASSPPTDPNSTEVPSNSPVVPKPFNRGFGDFGALLEDPNLLTHIAGDAITPPAADTSPYSLTRNAGRLEARSEDGRVVLVKTAQSLLRIEAPTIQIEDRTNDGIRIHVDGSATDRPSVGVLMGSDGLNHERLELIHGIAAQRPAINTHYIVQRGWDKALVAIPTPILVPEAMTLTNEWRNWQQVKDGRKLEYVDPLGRKYVLHGLGWAQNGVKLFPVIPRLERFRPDGTLEGWTSFFEEIPEATHFYETDGLTPAGSVSLRLSGIEGAPHVRSCTWRDSEGKYHQYDITPKGIIQYEALGKMGNIEEGQGFDMDSWVNQVDNGESSMEVSLKSDSVVKRLEIAGRVEMATLSENSGPISVAELTDASSDASSSALPPAEKAAVESFAPPIGLIVHAYQQVGQPIALGITIGTWPYTMSHLPVTLRCDGEEYELDAEFELTATSSRIYFLNEPAHMRDGPRLNVGKHRASLIFRSVAVHPKTKGDSDSRTMLASFDKIESNEVEFEVVNAIPADYFQPKSNDEWETILRNMFKSVSYKVSDSGAHHLVVKWWERLPFNLAFHVAIEEAGSGRFHLLGNMSIPGTSESPAVGPSANPTWSISNPTTKQIFPSLAGRRVRIILTPSVEAAMSDPSIVTYYGRSFTTPWVEFLQDPSPDLEQNNGPSSSHDELQAEAVHTPKKAEDSVELPEDFPPATFEIHDHPIGFHRPRKYPFGPDDEKATAPQGTREGDITWTFQGKREDGWHYLFTRTPPGGEGRAIESEVVYTGYSNVVTFEDDWQWIGIVVEKSPISILNTPPVEAPSLRLSTHQYHVNGMPNVLKVSFGDWPNTASLGFVAIRCDGEESMQFEVAPESDKQAAPPSRSWGHIMLGSSAPSTYLIDLDKTFGDGPDRPWRRLGKHRISVVLNLRMTPPPSSISYGYQNPAPFVEVETDEIEFEVVPELPEGYLQAEYEEGWEEKLRGMLVGVRYYEQDPNGWNTIQFEWREGRKTVFPFNLAFDVALQEEGSDELHAIGTLTAQTNVPAPSAFNENHRFSNAEASGDVLRSAVGKNIRLVLTPSTEVATTNPAIRAYYGKEFTTRWMRLKPDASQAARGASQGNFTRISAHGNPNKKLLIEKLGVICEPVADGGRIVQAPDASPHLLLLPDAFLPSEAVETLQRDPERLSTSETKEVTVSPGTLNHIAVLTETGETWILVIDTDAELNRKVYYFQAIQSSVPPAGTMEPGLSQ